MNICTVFRGTRNTSSKTKPSKTEHLNFAICTQSILDKQINAIRSRSTGIHVIFGRKIRSMSYGRRQWDRSRALERTQDYWRGQLFISRWRNDESITLVFIWNPPPGGKDIQDGVRLGHGFTLLLRYNRR